MRKTIVLLAAMMLAGIMQTTEAQTRRGTTPARKTTTAVRKTATTARKTAATVTPVSVDEPIFVNGHLAFMGVQLGRPVKEIEKDLLAKGFAKGKDRWGNESVMGQTFGTTGSLWFDDNGKGVMVTESKSYTLAQARQRVAALAAGLKTKGNGKITQKTALEDGGETIIVNDYGTIRISYNNEDEVEMTSKYYFILINFTDDPKPNVSAAPAASAKAGTGSSLSFSLSNDVLSAADAIKIYQSKDEVAVNQALQAVGYQFQGLDNKQMNNFSKNCELTPSFKPTNFGKGASSVVKYKIGGNTMVQVFNKNAADKFIEQLRQMNLNIGVGAGDGSAVIFTDDNDELYITVVCDKGIAYQEMGGYFLVVGDI